MDIIDNAVAVVELLETTWVILDSGEWMEIEDASQIQADVPRLNANDISYENEEIVLPDDQQSISIPQDIIASINNSSSQFSAFSTAEALSSAQTSNEESSDGQSGFQLLMRDGQIIIPESGYETAPIEQTEIAPEPPADIDPAPRFTFGSLGGTDVWINRYDADSLEVSGAADNVADGRTIQISFLDSNGDSIVRTGEVENGAWSITGIDITSLSDGELTATVLLVGGDQDDAASEVKVKDTLAEIDFDESNDDKTQGSFDVSGTVNGIQDGRTVALNVLDSDGNTVNEYQTTVVDSQWLVEAVDLTNVDDGEYTLLATVVDVAGNDAASSFTVTKDSTASISIEVEGYDSDVINENEENSLIVRGQVSDIEDGQDVTISVTDESGRQINVTTQVVDGEYQATMSTADLNDGLLTFNAKSIDTLGNTTTAETQIRYDTNATIDVSIDNNDSGFINQSSSQNVTISGSVNDIEDGQKVFVTITDQVGQNIVVTSEVSNSLFSADSIDLSNLDDGLLTIEVQATDFADNIASNVISVELDTTLILSTSINKTTDGVISSVADASNELRTLQPAENKVLVVDGQVNGIDDGQRVFITISDIDGNTITTQVEVNNSAYTSNALDVSGLTDGTLTLVAETTDSAGNTQQATDFVELDTTAEITTQISKTDDSVINHAESTQLTISGTVTGVEDSQQVTLTISDGVNSEIVVESRVVGGSYIAENIDVSHFFASDVTVEATVSDLAGNQASAQDSVEFDNIAAITASIDKTDDGVINGNGESAVVVVRGSVSDVEDGQTVTVVLSDSINEISVEAVVENGAYVTEPTDVSAFVDGTITATASVSDVAGNPVVSVPDSVELDNTTVITTSIDKTDDGVINGNGESAEVVVRGSVTDVEDGQTVTVVLSDGTNQVSVEAVVENGEYVT
ncbi:hypothetical protein Q9R01_09125, partial [Vibrio sp. HB161653]|nr:hypothetical protein [Vibrio sp. HB161653]